MATNAIPQRVGIGMVGVWFVLAAVADLPAQEDTRLREQAAVALDRAIAFYADRVSAHGGYVYKYSADLTKREGEGRADPDTVWVQPPGTPSVGEAFLDAWLRTRNARALRACEAAADCLIRGQLQSGGWNAQIDFGSELRPKYAYRTDAKVSRRARNYSSFDDDKTQSAMRYLIRYDQATRFQDARAHEAIQFALESVLKAQFPNGGWAQVYDGPPTSTTPPGLRASFPESWPRVYPGGDYWWHYTFNDNAMVDTMQTLFLAADVYAQPRYRESALRAGEFILLAQLPDPQPAWAQQYNAQMHPVWARKFEPPAVSGGESQNIVRMLLRLYEETGDDRFVHSAERALEYLAASRLPDGRLARFYELGTNRPLYFTKMYELTYDDSDLPTHYGFQVSSRVDELRRQLQELQGLSAEQLAKRVARYRSAANQKISRPSPEQVKSVIEQLDERGAWVEAGKLSYHGAKDPTDRIISSATFIRNLDLLSRFLADSAGRQ